MGINWEIGIDMYNTLCVYVCLVTRLCPTLCDPWTVAHQSPLSMEFSRQEYWSGLPLSSEAHEGVMDSVHFSHSVVSDSAAP